MKKLFNPKHQMMDSRMELLTSIQKSNLIRPYILKYHNRDDEFGFDWEEIMVMEAMWQSIQDQRIHLGDMAFGDSKMKTNKHVYTNPTFPVKNSLEEKSKDQSLSLESIGDFQHYDQTNKEVWGLASAIAASERQAMKIKAIFKPHEFADEIHLYENQPINSDKLECGGQPCNVTNVKDDCKIMSNDSFYNQKTFLGETRLHDRIERLKTCLQR